MEVAGRGELQLGILIETMRREGFELSVRARRCCCARTPLAANVGADRGSRRRPRQEHSGKFSSRSKTNSRALSCAGSGIFLQQHLRARHRELKTFAPHGLNQNAELSSPRPATSMESFSSDSRTRSATLPSASRSRRSRIMRPVTLSPSVPASGKSLTRNTMASVGGLIGCAGSGCVDGWMRRWSWRRWPPAGPARRDDVAGFRLLDRHALEPAERQHLGDATSVRLAYRRGRAP